MSGRHRSANLCEILLLLYLSGLNNSASCKLIRNSRLILHMSAFIGVQFPRRWLLLPVGGWMLEATYADDDILQYFARHL